MIDYGGLLLAPLYDVYGVPAILTLDDIDATTADLTAIDKTAGVAVGDNIAVGTVEPGAVIRLSELIAAGLTRESLDGATITFSGNVWRVASHHPKPVPSGEAAGEIILILELQ
ncbi:hypothetical protein GR217_34405 [Rhizobium leguminosarum]|uniref:Uncharacterized protein n=1 Tax=Rhizobium ruizarguesonis TaxID=2081791 RepID=A0AAE4YYQ8_9HYPH|nr:hypothetical protein [Rhizobium ruizarguesonis]NEI52713.1 hypothetical protein [Rhizobium ruizarguesonis]